MLYQINADQIGEYGRLEIAIRYIQYSTEERSYLPLYDWKHMLEIIQEGYWPEFIEYDKLPKWMEPLSYGKIENTNNRIVKKWCKKIFNKYGEPAKAQALHDKFFEDWEKQCESIWIPEGDE